MVTYNLIPMRSHVRGIQLYSLCLEFDLGWLKWSKARVADSLPPTRVTGVRGGQILLLHAII